MANFFIDRPIFAWVLAILLCLTGTLAILSLPVEQYPDLAPPNVRITANYPGASAQTLENTVTQVIEQNMTGLDNLMYMSSQSSATGQATITLSFTAGTDPDEAVQQVQNQLQSAMRKLPQAVQNQGVTVRKTGDTNILTLAFVSTDGSMDKQDIADYVASNIQDPLSRVNGVGDIDAYGSQYSMRIWLDPAKLNSYQMTTKDVTDAISSQNAQIAVGQLGGTPSVDKQALNATINSQSLLQTPEQFRNITLRVNQDGSEVTLGDVATVEMGAEKYDYLSRYNRQPASGLGIKLASGANEMATAERVINRLNELAQFFPHGLEYKVAYETTSFVKASITDVVKTLLEAILLVFLVMYLFLQNFRATLIPTIAVPVVLMGTFAVLYACGYSINTLTMFAMVLAIGLLVDDAIVVVENVERIMEQERLSPYEATKKAMASLGGALIAMSLVLCAVFVPVSFLAGITGQLYRQFTITIAVSVIISTVVALTLSPVMCAYFLRPDNGRRKPKLFRRINYWLRRGNTVYQRGIRGSLRHSRRMLAAFGILLVGIWLMNRITPQSFMPKEDQGYFTVELELPEGATLERTRLVTDRAMKYLMGLSDVEYVLNVTGSSPRLGSNQAHSQLTVILKPWGDRTSESIDELMEEVRDELSLYPESKVYLSSPAVIPGLGTSGGFEMVLEARGDRTYTDLQQAVDTLMYYAERRPELAGLSSSMQSDIPQLYYDVDRDKAQLLGVSMSDVFSTLKTFTGSVYVNDFNMFNRIYRVYVQAEAPYRAHQSNLDLFHVRGNGGAMIPVTALGTTHYTTGPGTIRRFNMFNAATISGEAAHGYSSGQAMEALEQIVREHLPANIGVEWSGLSYQEKHASGQTGLVLALALLFVFLFLAAQYESWSVPVAVILSLPIAGLGAYVGNWLCGLENNIYFQIGLVMLVGLVAKNAILIVEFAKEEVDRGGDLVQSALHAARLRFRPIVMTSLAFILGMLPLVFASGPGSASRQGIGTGVFFGMLVAITAGIVFVPFFFVWVYRIKDKFKRVSHEKR